MLPCIFWTTKLSHDGKGGHLLCWWTCEEGASSIPWKCNTTGISVLATWTHQGARHVPGLTSSWEKRSQHFWGYAAATGMKLHAPSGSMTHLPTWLFAQVPFSLAARLGCWSLSHISLLSLSLCHWVQHAWQWVSEETRTGNVKQIPPEVLYFLGNSFG